MSEVPLLVVGDVVVVLAVVAVVGPVVELATVVVVAVVVALAVAVVGLATAELAVVAVVVDEQYDVVSSSYVVVVAATSIFNFYRLKHRLYNISTHIISLSFFFYLLDAVVVAAEELIQQAFDLYSSFVEQSSSSLTRIFRNRKKKN